MSSKPNIKLPKQTTYFGFRTTNFERPNAKFKQSKGVAHAYPPLWSILLSQV
jgi:hypothetical protein